MPEKVTAPWDAATAIPIIDNPRRAALERLRAKFPEASVGKLPRVTCKACRDRSCQQHRAQKCEACGNYMTTAHIHLDYIGHAEVTDRMLSVDLDWNWEPLAREANGLPLFNRTPNGDPIGFWIKLTICGVTRTGFGSVEPRAFDAEKQLIGDALRNAAMRFGAALNLWSKNELESSLVESASTESERVFADAAADPVWDPKPANAPGTNQPSDSRRPSQVVRTVRGVPITVPDTWEMIRTLPIKGKSPYSKMTWGELDRQADPSEFTRWLEAGVNDILKRHDEAKERGQPSAPLPAAQRALIAFDHLLGLRAGTAERADDDEGVFLTTEEMDAADAKRAGGAS